MKKIMMIALMLFVALTMSFADGFQGVQWGDGPGGVYLEEGTDGTNIPWGNKLMIGYNRTIVGAPAQLFYVLPNNELQYGYIDFYKKRQPDMNRLVNALNAKYGTAVKEPPFEINQSHWIDSGAYENPELLYWLAPGDKLIVHHQGTADGYTQNKIVYYNVEYIQKPTAESDGDSL